MEAGAGFLGFLMVMQLVVVLGLLLGGIYALYCLSRAAAGLDRLASAVEDLVQRQVRAESASGGPMLPGGAVRADRLPVVGLPAVQNAPMPPQSFTPPMPMPAPGPTAYPGAEVNDERLR